MHRPLLAYFNTFRTHGTWLPGDARGYTHHTRSPGHDKRRRPARALESQLSADMPTPLRVLSAIERQLTDKAIRGVCEHRQWEVLALNVRSNHVHIVANGNKSPERMMNDFKSWATRRLREEGHAKPDEKIWARHGSTIHIFDEEKLHKAMQYTNDAQDGIRFELEG